MNWYKKAKMIDIGDDIKTYLYCPNCKRFATDKMGETFWVPYYEMNFQEQMEMDRIQNDLQEGSGTLSPKVCPDCKNRKI